LSLPILCAILRIGELYDIQNATREAAPDRRATDDSV